MVDCSRNLIEGANTIVIKAESTEEDIKPHLDYSCQGEYGICKMQDGEYYEEDLKEELSSPSPFHECESRKRNAQENDKDTLSITDKRTKYI